MRKIVLMSGENQSIEDAENDVQEKGNDKKYGRKRDSTTESANLRSKHNCEQWGFSDNFIHFEEPFERDESLWADYVINK